MRIVINILLWLASLIAASFVAGFFVSLGMLSIVITSGVSFDPITPKAALNSFGGIWLLSILPIASQVLIPALLLSFIYERKGRKPNKVIYAVVGSASGLAEIVFMWTRLEPTILLHPELWSWEYLPTTGPFVLGIAIGGYYGGREFAKLRNGRLRWRDGN